MNTTMVKIAKNPYLVGFLMIFLEMVTNVTTSVLLQKNLGETNVSFIVWFILAAAFVATVLKEPVTSAYGTKVTGTYFGIVILVIALGVIGKPLPGTPLLFILAVFAALVMALCYALFMFAQKRFVTVSTKKEQPETTITPETGL